MNVTIVRPDGDAYLLGEAVNISVYITDCEGNPLEKVSGPGLDYPEIMVKRSDFNFSPCTPTEGNGYYNCTWPSNPDLWTGWYGIRVRASKNPYPDNTTENPSAFFLATKPFLTDIGVSPQSGFWWETYNFYVSLTDSDGNSNNVTLWVSKDNVTWKEVRTVEVTPLWDSWPISPPFIITFTSEDEGVKYFKFNTTDVYHYTGESEVRNFTIYLCGDGICDPGESCSTCLEDCGYCSKAMINVTSIKVEPDNVTHPGSVNVTATVSCAGIKYEAPYAVGALNCTDVYAVIQPGDLLELAPEESYIHYLGLLRNGSNATASWNLNTVHRTGNPVNTNLKVSVNESANSSHDSKYSGSITINYNCGNGICDDIERDCSCPNDCMVCQPNLNTTKITPNTSKVTISTSKITPNITTIGDLDGDGINETLINTSIIGTANVSNNIIAILTKEWYYKDLNSDGDTNDCIIRYYDINTNILTNTGINAGCAVPHVVISKNIIAFTNYEYYVGEDLNSDGDKYDYILRYYDINTNTLTNTGIEIGAIDLSNNVIAFTSGGILKYYDLSTQTITDTGIYIGSYHPMIKIFNNTIAFINKGDFVLKYYDISTKNLTSTGIAAYKLDIFNNIIATNHRYLLRYYDINTNTLTNTGIGVHEIAISKNIIALISNDQLKIYDINTNTLTDTGIETNPYYTTIYISENIITFNKNYGGAIYYIILSGACAENWECSEWSSCSGGRQSRACHDSNACGTGLHRPEESRSCNVVVSRPGGDGGKESGVSLKNMTPRVAEIMKIEEPEVGVREIHIEVENPANDVEIRVRKVESRPAEVAHEVRGRVYQYINISHENIEETNIREAVIRFEVNRTWIRENRINKSTVSLNRYKESWEKLETRLVNESGELVHYEAETPGFSVFAITGDEEGETGTGFQINCTPGERMCAENRILECNTEGNGWSILETCTYGCNEETFTCNQLAGDNWITWVIVIVSVSVAVIVVVIFYFRRKRKTDKMVRSFQTGQPKFKTKI